MDLLVVQDKHKIHFASPTSSPKMPPLPLVGWHSLGKKMIVEFFNNGAIQSVNLDIPWFYSQLFMAEKKNGKWRLILNLKPLNALVFIPSMKLETVQSVRNLLQTGQWGASIDLKDGYLHVPNNRTFCKYLHTDFVCCHSD